MHAVTVSELISSFQKACSTVHADATADARTFAQSLAEVAQVSVAHCDTDACDTLIGFAVSAFDTEDGASVMNEVLFEVFEPLQACGSASTSGKTAFGNFIGEVAAKCNPQESLTLFLATLGEASE